MRWWLGNAAPAIDAPIAPVERGADERVRAVFVASDMANEPVQ